MNEIGVWPWPRALHGRLVDRLVALGARRIVFDMDFSAASTPDNDRAFAQAIANAHGKSGSRPSSSQAAPTGERPSMRRFPLLSEHAGAVSIDVPLAADGFVREYDSARAVGGWILPTAGALLAGHADDAPRRFAIDYGLNFDNVPRLSAADVLAGRTPKAAIAGRDVIVGASAEELRDFFLTPRGVLPGLAMHAYAAETMLMRRELQTTPPLAVVALILALALAAGALERRLSASGSVLSLALAASGVEAGALALHKWAALMTPTAGVQASLAIFALGGLVSALRLRRRMHTEAARERDNARAMLNQVIADNFDGVVVIGDDGRILEASRPAQDIVNRSLRNKSYAVLPPATGASGRRGAGGARSRRARRRGAACRPRRRAASS